MRVNLKELRKKNLKLSLRTRRKLRIRQTLEGTAERPRITVFKSAKHIYVQAINDAQGLTLASASTLDAELKSKLGDAKKTDAAALVGKLLATRLKAKGVESVVFDRNGFSYRGRIAAVADSAREAGLNF